jgi:hypothetical protein
MRSCELLLTLFGPKLDVEIAVLILGMYEKARAVLTPYEIIPDLLGVPFERLRPNRRGESSVPFVQAMINGAIRDVEQLLRICAALLREIGNRFPDLQNEN